MKKILLPLLFLIVFVAAGAVGYVLFLNDSDDVNDYDMEAQETDMDTEDDDAVVTKPPPPPPPPTPVGSGTGALRTIDMAASNYSFTLKEIRVNRGDTVKIIFRNASGFHDFTLNEFNVKTPQLSAGDSEVVTFVADKVGSFEYYCSVGSHRQMGMVGTLIVE